MTLELTAPAEEAPEVSSAAAELPDESGFRLAAVVAARCYLAFGAGLILWAVMPILFGWSSFVVLSGSMEPRIQPGDVVAAMPIAAADIRPGQVVVFDDPNHPGHRLVHRVRQIRPDGRLVTRGDANPTDDGFTVDPKTVHGVGRLRIGLVGLPFLWLTQGDLLPLGLWFIVTTGAIALVGADRRRNKILDALEAQALADESDSADDGDESGGSDDSGDSGDAEGSGGPPRTGAGVTRPSRRTWGKGAPGRTALSMSAVVLASVPLMATPAMAAFSATTKNQANHWTVSPYAQFGTGDYIAAITPDAPWGWWHISENGPTTAADSSGNNRNGAFSAGGITYRVTGMTTRQFSGAVTLNGSSGCITNATSVANPTAYSVEIWFSSTSTTGGKLMGLENLQTGTGSTRYDRQLWLGNNGTINFGVRAGTGGAATVISSAPGFNDGYWHHAVGTMSAAAGMVLYVDGFSVGANANKLSDGFTGFWRIGCGALAGWAPAATSSFLAATIDEPAVYSTALTALQVRNHYFAA